MRRYGKGCISCNRHKHKILAYHANIVALPTLPCNVPANSLFVSYICNCHPLLSRIVASAPCSSVPGISRSLLKYAPYIFLGFFWCFQLTLKLGVLHRLQNTAENRPRTIAHLL